MSENDYPYKAPPRCDKCDDTGWYFVHGYGSMPQLERCSCMKKTDIVFVALVVLVILCVVATMILLSV